MADFDEMKGKGYSSEDEYFFKLNQELLKKRRAEREKELAEQSDAAEKKEFWMRCPKCGGDMAELEWLGIMVDRCSQCEGVFFDRGEVEILLQAEKPEGFLKSMRRLIGG